MSKDLNKAMLTGHLGGDPQMRYTDRGSAVTTFSVASNRSWKSTDGQAHVDTEWFRVVAWDKLAEICNEYLKKGTRVYIEGRLQTRQWQDTNTGQNRSTTEVVASDMIILSSKQDRPENVPDYEAVEEEIAPPTPTRRPTPAPAAAPATPARAPTGGNGNGASRQSPGTRQPARNVPQTLDSDEDLPF